MSFWLIAALMAAATAGVIVVPALRRPRATAARARHDLAVYRDQLAELSRDAARGLISAAELDAARAEIGRRALAADAAARQANEAPSAPSRAGRRWQVVAGIAAVVAPLGAVAIYADLGAPRLAAGNATAPPAVERARASNRLVNQLAETLRGRPDDLAGWRLYARSLVALQRHGEAVAAYGHAVSLAPNDAGLRALMAEAEIFAANGEVTREARATIEAALALDPAEPRARYYLGLDEAQANRPRAALAEWRRMIAEAPPDAEFLPVVRGRVAALEAALADADAAPQAGPDEADIAAAARMTPEERMAMIRAMVAGLAARLEQSPDDADGWLRLGRAYRVLGETDKARAAFARAASLLPEGSPERQAAEEAARS